MDVMFPNFAISSTASLVGKLIQPLDHQYLYSQAATSRNITQRLSQKILGTEKPQLTEIGITKTTTKRKNVLYFGRKIRLKKITEVFR